MVSMGCACCSKHKRRQEPAEETSQGTGDEGSRRSTEPTPAAVPIPSSRSDDRQLTADEEALGRMSALFVDDIIRNSVLIASGQTPPAPTSVDRPAADPTPTGNNASTSHTSTSRSPTPTPSSTGLLAYFRWGSRTASPDDVQLETIPEESTKNISATPSTATTAAAAVVPRRAAGRTALSGDRRNTRSEEIIRPTTVNETLTSASVGGISRQATPVQEQLDSSSALDGASISAASEAADRLSPAGLDSSEVVETEDAAAAGGAVGGLGNAAVSSNAVDTGDLSCGPPDLSNIFNA